MRTPAAFSASMVTLGDGEVERAFGEPVGAGRARLVAAVARVDHDVDRADAEAPATVAVFSHGVRIATVPSALTRDDRRDTTPLRVTHELGARGQRPAASVVAGVAVVVVVDVVLVDDVVVVATDAWRDVALAPAGTSASATKQRLGTADAHTRYIRDSQSVLRDD